MQLDLQELGVTNAKIKQFESRGIMTVEDLLSFLPRCYKDYSKITGILPPDQTSCIRVKVLSTASKNAGKVPYITANCVTVDGKNKINVIWFRSQWMYGKIRDFVNRVVVVAGKATYNEQYNSYSIAQPELFDTEDCLGIYPVYKNIQGMSVDYLTDKVKKALAVGMAGSEIIPDDIVKRENFLPMPTALRYIHTPKTIAESEAGNRRILINDLLYFALHNELNKASVSKGSQYNIKSVQLMNEIIDRLPYKLTPDQETAVSDMVAKAKDGRRLQALLQADVGAGKTICAALLAAAFIGSGYQVVLMAPTQVLARQHLDTVKELFDPLNVEIAYLDSTLKTSERKAVLAEISSGRASFVVGTHSCIGKDAEYNDLALTIVDEEHKFGVKQRAAIVQKAADGVHSITMSATPIPRSLAQVVYGDNLQLYTIQTMPEGRKPVITGVAKDQGKVFKFILSEVKKGHQIYVVCPLIDASEASPDIESVESVSEMYRSVLELCGVRVATLTGRDDKLSTESIIGQFKSGFTDVLIATTVIEVGVNVPNATVMVIHNAERFGLSGLHQLRGRVGRGSDQSYCVLRSDSDDEKALNRLNVLCTSSNGFEIAEADLKMRGAGDFLGTRQSGDNKYIMLMLANNKEYQNAVEIARELIDRGPNCCKLMQKVIEERIANSQE